MSMLNGVEIRSPFVTGRIRRSSILNENESYTKGKKLLKDAYKEKIIKPILQRKKAGFTRNNLWLTNEERSKKIAKATIGYLRSIDIYIESEVLDCKKDGRTMKYRLVAIAAWLKSAKVVSLY